MKSSFYLMDFEMDPNSQLSILFNSLEIIKRFPYEYIAEMFPGVFLINNHI